MTFSSKDIRELLTHANKIAEQRDEPLISELSEALNALLRPVEEFQNELEAQGLPITATLTDLIRHHRSNAATAAALREYVDQRKTRAYDPTRAELEAVVAEVYGPGAPEQWQLANAYEALMQANKYRP